MNEAYTTLRNPHIRAEYLLRQNGVEIGEGAQSITDAELIMEVMEIREAIEDSQTQEEVDGLTVTNEEQLREWCAEADEAFQAGDLDAMTRCGVRLQYYGKIRTELQQWGGIGLN